MPSHLLPSFGECYKKSRRNTKSNSNSSALDNTIVVYKDHGTCNLTTYNHSQSIPQTSWNQSKTPTLTKTSDVGLINLGPVSTTTPILSNAQATIVTI